MPKINIKPLSVNNAWQGRRFATDAYKSYTKSVLLMLPKITVPDGNLLLQVTFGLSSKNADVDNPVKCFVDCLQKKYDFNDRKIYKMIVEKIDVAKGDEFIEFSLGALL